MLREKLGLSEQGLKNFRRGVFFCTLANLVLMAPIGVLFMLVNDFMAYLNGTGPLPDLLFYTATSLVVLFLIWLTQRAEYANTYNLVYAESARKRASIAEHLRRLPLSFFGERDLADLTTVIMKDCSDQERMFMHVVPQLFGTGIMLVIVIVALLFYNWQLTIAAFWVVPVAIFIIAVMHAAIRRRTVAQEQARLAMSESVQEYLDCAQEIRATNQRSRFLEGVDAHLDEFERAQVAAELTTGASISSAQAFLKLGIATTIMAGSVMLVAGQIDFMTFFAYLLVVTRVYDPVNLVLQSSAELVGIRLAIKRTNAIMAEKPMDGSESFAPHGHDLVFDDVTFSYNEGETVLSNVSFAACEGQVTALVGPSGSGKSTVAKIAARFWDVDAGRVTLGGVDVSSVDPEVLLSDYAWVFQDVVLFDDTVMENIRLGRAGATDAEVRAAAKAALCDEFVCSMPQGYETRIGENGARLSGGQRQRISIARALLKDAPVVFLDEATASLDVESESKVQAALSRLLAGKTVIVIAHRMRTVMDADKVVVLDAGRVAEQGSPAELLQLEDGLFKRMVTLQNAAASWTV